MVSHRNCDLLVVDDDDEFRGLVARRFRRRAYHVEEAGSGADALAWLAKRHFDVALLDLVLPGMDGLELLERLRESDPECQAVMLTGRGSIPTAVEAIKRGACDYLTKPCDLAELEIVVAKAYERGSLHRENLHLRAVLERSGPKAVPMIGECPAMMEVKRLIAKAAPTDSSVLVQGDSGTGKELVARALHEGSPRADKPLVVVNCAALQETLLESELFGHERGAFTGAVVAKPGLFEVAEGGTLFIDEVGEMAGGLQAKLLRVLEDGHYRRVGSTRERRANVRVLAATNKDLATEIEAGRFRDDLYFRINVLAIELPPLRERGGDIDLLIDHVLASGNRGPRQIEPNARWALQRYSWPGNVRELANAIERAKILAEDDWITLEDLPSAVVRGQATPVADASAATGDLAELERHHIEQVLVSEAGNKVRAAKVLGISRRRLYRLLEKHGLSGSPSR
jgi:DNA-binding NtrC family response regulator